MQPGSSAFGSAWSEQAWSSRRGARPPTLRPLTRLGGVLSAQGLVASNLNLKPGECLRVRGEVPPDAKR